jgi:metallophosphoesterase (TIGR00282 family)
METRTAVIAGDLIGEVGVAAFERHFPSIKERFRADFAVVNGENAAGGFGLSAELSRRIFAAGADVITSGNHVWEKREFLEYLGTDERVLRPLNYPPACPGRGVYFGDKDGTRWAVVNLQGREFMTAIDCPFRAFDALFPRPGGGARPLIIVDFHAESAEEKEALAFYLDGRASALAGTHTHVQTADERVLPGGLAYISDVGMTGARESVIGMDAEICLRRAKTQVLFKMECAQGDAPVQGAAVTIDAASAAALSITRFSIP